MSACLCLTISQAAAAKLHADPSDCLILEDAPNGVEAAKAAGTICMCLQCII